jgi:hypothetical protein
MSISARFPTDLQATLARHPKIKTQHALALATEIHDATISRYCNGLRPTPEHAAKITEALR